MSKPPVPIPEELLQLVEAGNGEAGQPRTRLLRALTFDYEWAGSGPLSVKCVIRGEAMYGVGQGRFKIDASRCLLINHGQSYQVDVRAQEGVEMFAVFFAPGFVEEAARALRWSEQRLLDDPDGGGTDAVEFTQHLVCMPRDLTWELRALSRRAFSKEREEGLVDEGVENLAAFVLREEGRVGKQARRLSTLRAGTRLELFRRLLRARDFAASCFEEGIGLDDLARVACLSRSHLLRSFREAFGQTPHRFLTSCRLKAAQRLLEETELPVTEICLSLGFQSLGSFCTLFRSHFGAPPTAYRKKSFSRSAGVDDSDEMAGDEKLARIDP